jgi:hypothetical protein
MKDIYEEIMEVCWVIAASYPTPRFYASCAEELDASRSTFESDEGVRRCRERIREELPDHFGHGIAHVEKVAVEAGALVWIEGSRQSLEDPIRREARRLVQLAGLLHDLRRGEKNHAQGSALAAGKVLAEFRLHLEEEQWIMGAIANHEAFVEPTPVSSVVGQLISNALYDADKFRWGPDNFTVTLWQMLRFSRAPIERLVRRFPKGMEGIARIRSTFRTDTGKIYGPEFIDLGLQMGGQIYEFLKRRFPPGV